MKNLACKFKEIHFNLSIKKGNTECTAFLLIFFIIFLSFSWLDKTQLYDLIDVVAL